MIPSRSIRPEVHSRGWRGLWVVLGVVAVASIGGCYERVIKAKGLGASGTAVSKPYASDTALDRAVMGPMQKPSGTKRIKSAQWEPTGK